MCRTVRKRYLAVVGLAIAMQVASAVQDAPGSLEPPALTTQRHLEDYTYLRDPKNRSGAWWEPLKYIPLDPAGWAYLTVGDEVRIRYERYWNNAFGSAVKPDEDYLRYRALPYADLHLGPYFRVFGQLQAAWSTRSVLTKNPFTDETSLDLAQGFADVRLPVGEDGRVTLRGGRQILEYGAQRFVSSGPNIKFMFDGGLARWERGDWRADAFFVQPVKPDFDWFDDRADSSRKLWSVYATQTLPRIRYAYKLPAGRDVPPTRGTRTLSQIGGSGLDLYYIGYDNEAARFNQGAGHERRHTFGVRYFGLTGPWTWDLEANFQTGDFAGGNIRAGSLVTAARYWSARLPLKPYVALRANVISGDGDPNDRTLGTFNGMFSTTQYLGDIGQLGPANLISLRPSVGIDLGSGWTLSSAAVFYWRQSLDDGIYGSAFNLLRSHGGSRARYIGTQAEAVLGWAPTRNLSFRAVYSVFQPGRFIEETGPAKTVHFAEAQVVFKY